MKMKKNTECFAEEPLLNLQFHIGSKNKVSEALKYSMWPLISILAVSDSQGNGYMKLSISKNFNFQPLGDTNTM